jgi:hypothetical protein
MEKMKLVFVMMVVRLLLLTKVFKKYKHHLQFLPEFCVCPMIWGDDEEKKDGVLVHQACYEILKETIASHKSDQDLFKIFASIVEEGGCAW